MCHDFEKVFHCTRQGAYQGMDKTQCKGQGGEGQDIF